MTSGLSILLVNIGNLIAAMGAIYFKLASGTITIRNFIKSKKLMIGIILYVVSSIVFVIALRGGELTILYPMVASVYIWISLFSMWILKERMNVYKWTGVLFILVGVSLVGIG